MPLNHSGRVLVMGAAAAALSFAVTLNSFQAPEALGAPKQNPCALGQALSEAGEAKEARKAFVQVLRADPSSRCAARGLKELNTVSPPKKPVGQCAVGDAYLEVHRDDDAAAAYKKALEEDPKRECAKHGLITAGKSRVTRYTDAIIGAIPTFLVIGGIVLVLWYLLLFSCQCACWKEKLVRFPLVGKRVKHLLRPRLAFADFGDEAVEGKPGGPLTARVKQRLAQMRDEALATETPEYDLDFGTPREEFADQVSDDPALKTALDSAGEVSEQTKLVAALVNILSAFLPIRRFEVSGTLEPPAASGAALTLNLAEVGRSDAATHLDGPRKHSSPDASDYMVLADPAAVWIQYEIASSLSGDDRTAGEGESQALLREGLDRYQREEMLGARSCLEQAISRDHTNWGAYVCLAVVEARAGGNYRQSIKRILQGIEARKAAVANA